MGAWVKATRGWDGVWWRPTRASTGTGWEDTLLFMVPAGNYPEGLKVEAFGYVGGHVGKSGLGTAAAVGFYARLGPEPLGSFAGKVELQSYDDNQVVVVDTPFVLEASLLPPGTVLTDSIIVELQITAGFGDPLLGASTWAGGIYEAWSQSDFASSLSVDSITVPAGVTWTSASGVFLTQSVGSCRGDFDGDGDVDGTDSVILILDPDQLDLILFAAQFGRSDCHH